MTDTRRLLDANANRAREALRVMEDAARFMLNDHTLSAELKTLRHDLADALALLPDLVAHRNTPGDVGTTITTEAEARRDDPLGVAVAAGKRLSEALRSLEEFGKLTDAGPTFAARIEALRYRGYDLESRLVARLTGPNPHAWRLCVLITQSLCTHHDWLDVARQSIDAGADCIQLREKDLTDERLHAAALSLVTLADRTDTGCAVIVNDRPDIALAAGAHGVHLGQHDLSIQQVRRIAGCRLLVGISTHNLDEAALAVDAGADYCGVGAVFATPTKDRTPAGTDYVNQFVQTHPHTPHLAIGGITPENITEVIEAGASAVAVSACVCGAQDPAHVVKQLLDALPTQA